MAGGKVPPSNTDAEKSILGAVLLDKEAIIKIAEFLLPEHIYDPKHGEIYSAVMELFDEGLPVDIVTLSDRLKAKRKLTKVGGRAYLTELAESVPTAAHAEEYGLVLCARFFECFRTPRIPVDRIVAVLKQVRACFVGQSIWHFVVRWGLRSRA